MVHGPCGRDRRGPICILSDASAHCRKPTTVAATEKVRGTGHFESLPEKGSQALSPPRFLPKQALHSVASAKKSYVPESEPGP